MMQTAQPLPPRPAKRMVRFGSPVSFALLMSALFLAFFNGRFWQDTIAGYWHGQPADLLFLATLALLLLLLYSAMLLLMPGNLAMIVLAGLLFPLASMAAFCADNFGLAVNGDMIRNLGATDRREALGLLSWRIAFYAVCFGVLPLFLVARSQIAALDLRAHLRHRLAFCAAAALLLMPLVGMQTARFQDFASQRRDLHYLSVPGAAVQGVLAYAGARWQRPPDVMPDASGSRPQRVGMASGGKPLLLFLVIGETARHQNFQLGGYARPTNPGLAATPDVYYFGNVTACATTTAVSVPCMLSHLGRERFSLAAATRSPNVLAELAQAGVEVSLRSNNGGSKGIGDVPATLDFSDSRARPWCNDVSCVDGILLQGLQQALAQGAHDRLMVFHQMGSHGPAYAERYPQEAAAFAPACATNDLARCSLEEIRNAYDNTVRYTDLLLTAQIGMLRQVSDRYDTALVYLSDHGESLGENGVHLHGAPYEVAPPEQLRIPLVLWMSDGYRARFGIDAGCMRRQLAGAYSHDNLYHTLLGAMGVRTGFYRGAMDVVEPCRSGAN